MKEVGAVVLPTVVQGVMHGVTVGLLTGDEVCVYSLDHQ